MEKKDLLVVGELNVDILFNHIGAFPVIGEEILAGGMSLTLGSSSAIFASNIASLGATTSFCGILGQDLFGRFLLDELQKRNVDTRLVLHSAEHKTGATVILNYAQDRANITYCGAMEFFSIDDIPLTELDGFKHLHFSSYFLQKAMRAGLVSLFKTAKEKGLSTSFDIQWDPENRWDFPYQTCLPYVDLFLPNEAEALSLSGEKGLVAALGKLGQYAKMIIVKKGIEGALTCEGGVITKYEPFHHDQFVDAIGAGDSFNAGFIFKYLSKSSLADCMKFANLAGAMNTTGSGGTSAFDGSESFEKKAKQLFNISI